MEKVDVRRKKRQANQQQHQLIHNVNCTILESACFTHLLWTTAPPPPLCILCFTPVKLLTSTSLTEHLRALASSRRISLPETRVHSVALSPNDLHAELDLPRELPSNKSKTFHKLPSGGYASRSALRAPSRPQCPTVFGCLSLRGSGSLSLLAPPPLQKQKKL